MLTDRLGKCRLLSPHSLKRIPLDGAGRSPYSKLHAGLVCDQLYVIQTCVGGAIRRPLVLLFCSAAQMHG
ncbi:hypothetical protein WJX79_009261 [Trebouxia sp. C0005]